MIFRPLSISDDLDQSNKFSLRNIDRLSSQYLNYTCNSNMHKSQLCGVTIYTPLIKYLFIDI